MKIRCPNPDCDGTIAYAYIETRITVHSNGHAEVTSGDLLFDLAGEFMVCDICSWEDVSDAFIVEEG